MYLGIDAGGTHTDAACIHEGRIVAAAKAPTDHADLPGSVSAVLAALPKSLPLDKVRRVTLGTTLAVNALVQGRADAVGLALTAGPGLAPARFALGEHVCVVPGGLDHRGVEVTPCDTAALAKQAKAWKDAGVNVFAVAGKFSPRNPAHEDALAAAIAPHATGGHISLGHRLSGLLNFPRRIAGAYFNSAVWRLHNAFADAVMQALATAGVRAPVRLLKADGGAVPLDVSRGRPVDSILSGPAASVMGVLALCELEGDSLLLDMGGTTTDIALYADASPALDRDCMALALNGAERRTPVRALAARSIGLGGDSLLWVEGADVRVGPLRNGPAMAFGGAEPTFLDALNVLADAAHSEITHSETMRSKTGHSKAERSEVGGDVARSLQGVAALAAKHNMTPHDLARKAADAAMRGLVAAVNSLTEHINARPIYTLAALLEDRRVRPTRVYLVGGPATMARGLVEAALGIPVIVPPSYAVANAMGAALTLPTAELELFADTTQGVARVPALDWKRSIQRGYTKAEAEADALALLHAQNADAHDAEPQEAEVIESDIFATLDGYGYGGKDIRVRCQWVPGIAARIMEG